MRPTSTGAVSSRGGHRGRRVRTGMAGVVLACVLVGSAGHAAPQTGPTPQAFQSRIDLITLDVGVLDRQGHPVEDLRARDFDVKVGGKSRDVVSAEFVKVEPPPEAPPVASTDVLVSTNAVPPSGRKVAIAVDQTQIRPASITPLITTAQRFVDALGPQDYAAFLAFPEPGPRVDFTTDKARVRQAMQGIIGQPSKTASRDFEISLSEAVGIANGERMMFDSMRENPLVTAGPYTRQVLDRGCKGKTRQELTSDEIRECLILIQQEAVLVATDARQESDISLRALESLLKQLGAIEGRKSLILVSGGLLIERLPTLDEVVRLAAAARTSINVVAVDLQHERSETLNLPNSQPSSTLQDRSLELQGLETIGDRTGGSFIRFVAGRGNGIFDRLATEMSSWYLVAVERRPGDPDELPVEVSVKRRGVTVRANRTFVAADTINAGRSGDTVLSEALSSPLPLSGVPLRVSTFTQRDGSSGKYRLHVAAQVGQAGADPGEFSVGYVMLARADRRMVTSMGRRVTLRPGGDKGPLQFDTTVIIDPGTYALRFGVVDAAGRRGTIVRDVDLPAIEIDGLATSDLIVGDVPDEGKPLHPAVEPHVTSGRLAGYVEIYPSAADAGDLAVAFEVAEGAATPALAVATLNVGAAEQPGWEAASGAIDVTLLPGRYVARATVRRGGEVLRVLSRPFVLDPTTAVARPAEIARGIAITPEMQRRTAAYVGQVVGGLSNVVAEEQFVLSDPGRRVTSDFLLVRYPGSERDFLPFRDVTTVDGRAVPDHEERITDLFLKPIGIVRDRVRQIVGASEAYVPTIFNPVFVLAFLQADFQPRFELTVSDAGPEWPAKVKAVTFVETARPTLLRAGPRGDQDAPVRGTAWVEDGTGRVLQTELRVSVSRETQSAITRFALDQRLQIMVPVEMRTTNPAGVATYGNFRRFNVRTATELPPNDAR